MQRFRAWIMMIVLFLRYLLGKLHSFIMVYVEAYFKSDEMRLMRLNEYSETLNWQQASLRRIIMNPTGPERAILTCSDDVLFYYNKNTDFIVLHYDRQIDISCGAFRPWISIELAIGGMDGICLWHQCRKYQNTSQPIWLGLETHDFVTNLQWSKDGSQLVCSLLRSRCIQIWSPDIRQVLNVIPLRKAESFLWILSFIKDIDDLSYHLRMNNKKNGFSAWEGCINRSMRLQTACWTKTGNLLIAERRSSNILCCTLNTENGIFHAPRPQCKIEKILDLNCVSVEGQNLNCVEIQALTIDPTNNYVAILLTRHPFMIVCCIQDGKGCSVILVPLQVLNCNACLNAYPTCLTFAYDDHLSQLSNSLFIGWSTGRVQQMPVRYFNSVKKKLLRNWLMQ